MLRFLFLVASLLVGAVAVVAHEHHGDAGPSCDSSHGGSGSLLVDYRPGTITVDGRVEDWEEVESSEFSLLPALDPDLDKAYEGGKIFVKAVHDGSNVFFTLEVDGHYAYSKGENARCPSVALMFQVGENASYYNMGGCKDLPDSCTSKSCRGHEVDIMHFSIGTAIPGRLYGGNHVDNAVGNGGDRFGHLVDVYSWNPHCRYLDGLGPKGTNNSDAQNDWHGAWWHSSLTLSSGFVDDDSPFGSQDQKGTYYFEFSRPMRTMDRFQQDAQFTIGEPSKMGVAFWYPNGGKPWRGSDHYSASCVWLTMHVQPSEATHFGSSSNRSWDAATAFALLLSVVSVCLTLFMGCWVSKTKGVSFTPIGRS